MASILYITLILTEIFLQLKTRSMYTVFKDVCITNSYKVKKASKAYINITREITEIDIVYTHFLKI